MNKIVILPIDDLIDFSEHPFKVSEDEEMGELAEFFGVNYRKDFLNL